MLKVSGISKRFGAQEVLRDVSFVVNVGEVAAIVGPNGAGKTTLLSIIAEEQRPDAGSVQVNRGARVRYLRQGYDDKPHARVSEVFPHAFKLARREEQLATLAHRMARASEDERATIEWEYDAVLAAASKEEVAAIEEARNAVGLGAIAHDAAVGSLSGGELTKLGLMGIVTREADLLLLDEPTNSLDLEGLTWLDGFLAGFSGAVVVVSHDRALLDTHATCILEIDPPTHGLERFDGSFSEYAEEKARRRDELWSRYRRQQERERRVEREVRNIKATAQRHESLSQNDFYRRKAKKVARRASALERRLRRELDSEERVAKPIRRAYGVKADLEAVGRGGDQMLVARDLEVFGGARHLLRVDDLSIAWGERVVLTGRNGSGKTSLLRTLLDARSRVDGLVRLSPSTRVGHLAQSDPGAEDADARTPVDVIRAAAGISETEARRHLHRFLFAGDGALTPVAKLSYGERRRLALAELVVAGANLLLLDEPTNHLDIPSREAFEEALDAYDGAILAVTHDRFFIERFGARVLSIQGGRLVASFDAAP